MLVSTVPTATPGEPTHSGHGGEGADPSPRPRPDPVARSSPIDVDEPAARALQPGPVDAPARFAAAMLVDFVGLTASCGMPVLFVVGFVAMARGVDGGGGDYGPGLGLALFALAFYAFLLASAALVWPLGYATWWYAGRMWGLEHQSLGDWAATPSALRARYRAADAASREALAPGDALQWWVTTRIPWFVTIPAIHGAAVWAWFG